MLLINESHQFKILFGFRSRFVVKLRSMDSEDLALTAHAECFMITINPRHNFATSSRQLFF